MKPFLLISGLLFSIITHAEIYELIDKDGRKTYTDKPPINETDAKPVTTSAKTSNTWQKDAEQEASDSYFDEEEQRREAEINIQNDLEGRIEKAKERLAKDVEQAEKDLESAREITAGDYYPNKKEGMIYTQQYRERVKAAEDNLERYKEALDSANNYQ